MQAVETEVDNKYAAIDASLQDLLAQMSSLNVAIAALQNKGAVKSVQRGTLNTSDEYDGKEGYTKYLDISISAVNTSKSLLVVNASGVTSGNPSSGSYCTFNGKIVNSSTIRLYSNINSDGATYNLVNWQVIEFYYGSQVGCLFLCVGLSWRLSFAEVIDGGIKHGILAPGCYIRGEFCYSLGGCNYPHQISGAKGRKA